MQARASRNETLFHPDDNLQRMHHPPHGQNGNADPLLPRGVCWSIQRRCYEVRISINGRRKRLGYYKTLAEAEEAIREIMDGEEEEP